MATSPFGDIAREAAEKMRRQAEQEAPRKANGHDPAADAEAFARFFQFPWQFPKPQPPTLIKGLLSHGEEFLVYGPPEAGKSFFAVDLACCWASGENWRGRPMDRGLVLYLAGERSDSIKKRVLAWALRNGKRPTELPVAVLGTSINLMSPGTDEVDALVSAIQAARRLAGMDAIAIIGDTVHSLSPGSKEDNHSFGVLTGQCRRIRDALGQGRPPALVYVHHTGKDEDRGPRGGNSLTASVSLSVAIGVRLQKYRLVEIDKGNDLAGDKPHVEPFVIENVTLRHAEDGTPVQAGVHVAIPITDVPDVPEEELRRIALRMHREGNTQRTIAKAIGRSVGTVNNWLTGEGAKRSAGGCP
jgi:AAA domain/Homeodomain-like domain